MIAHTNVSARSSSSHPTQTPGADELLNPTQASQPMSVPYICRRSVRIAVYSGLVAFFLWMLGWGLIPSLLDPTFEHHIEEKNVLVGMSREQVLEAWGSPYQMNVSYTSKGIRREEWVFEDWIDAGTISHRYLYFEEGKLVGGWR